MNKWIMIILIFLLVGCNTEKNPSVAEPTEKPKQGEEVTEPVEQPGEEVTEPVKEVVLEDIEVVADKIVKAMHEQNLELISTYVHPKKGVRFTPYSYIDLETDVVLSAEEVKDGFNNDKTLLWGSFDGTGDPIELTFEEYFHRFVYDVEFLHGAEKSVDERLSQGNTLDNNKEIYPDGTTVEYHIPMINPEYQGMDWRSLRLVFEVENNKWYLVGIIHDEWTI